MCQQIIITCLKKYGKNEIPWINLKFLIGEIIYGGKVIDSYDRRILLTYVEEYFGGFIYSTYQPFNFYNCVNSSKSFKYINMQKKLLDKNKRLNNLKGKCYICVNIYDKLSLNV